MATYATDLTVLNACDSVTGWSELPAPHASGASPAADTENYFHNGISISQATGQATGTGAGIQFDNGAALTWTATSNWVIMYWSYYAAPTNLLTWSSGGMRLGVGSADNNAYIYNAMGNNFGKYPYGGWQNTAIDPEYATPDATIGTVGAGYQNFAILPNITAKITKGSPLAVDVLRYGRGELQVTGTSATFDGMALANDNATTGRWGLFQSEGSSYLWKGLMSLGLTGTSTTFSDTNKAISIADTPRILAGFNKVEINNASTSINWTNIIIAGVETSITGSAPISAGDFEVVDNATVSFTGCSFTDMGTFIFNDGTNSNDILTSTFRRCGIVTQGGATFTGSLFDSADSTIALSADNIDVVTDCTFISDGTGHAVDLGTISTNTTVLWDNTLDDGAGSEWTGSAGGPTTGPSGTANDAILCNVNSGILLTISVQAGATIPTTQNTGTGDVTISAGEVTTKVIVKHSDGTLLITEDANVLVEAAAGGPLAVGTDIIKGFTDTNGEIQDVRSFASNQPITGRVRKGTSTPFYKTFNFTGTIDTISGFTQTCTLIEDE